MDTHIQDTFNRPLRDLRISVTDRCNFRCTYCMPKDIFGRDYPFLPRSEMLSFEEITQIAGIFTRLGVSKLRITGGEPLVRRNVEELVSMLSSLRNNDLPHPLELTLTTNGSRLREKVKQLREAGLDRITVSLDSLDDNVFRAMNDVDFPVAQVLFGIDAAMEAGLPVKVNMVVQRGVNEASIVPMARHFKKMGCILRFVEYMDVGSTNGWQLKDVVPASEIISRINEKMPIEPVDANYTGEVARRYRYKDGHGEIGIIASVTMPFCSGCTRMRLSADGSLYTCLFSSKGTDLRAALRAGYGDQEIKEIIERTWKLRTDRYSELRTDATVPLQKIEMSRIGG